MEMNVHLPSPSNLSLPKLPPNSQDLRHHPTPQIHRSEDQILQAMTIFIGIRVRSTMVIMPPCVKRPLEYHLQLPRVCLQGSGTALDSATLMGDIFGEMEFG